MAARTLFQDIFEASSLSPCGHLGNTWENRYGPAGAPRPPIRLPEFDKVLLRMSMEKWEEILLAFKVKHNVDPTKEERKKVYKKEYEEACSEAKRFLDPILPKGHRLYHFERCGVSIDVYIYVDEDGRWYPTFFHDGLPSNWQIVLCNGGIAVGRMIPDMSLRRCIFRKNRVTLFSWNEADTITSLTDNSPVQVVVPPIPEITPESSMADHLVYAYMKKEAFVPLSGEEEAREMRKLGRGLDNLYKYGDLSEKDSMESVDLEEDSHASDEAFAEDSLDNGTESLDNTFLEEEDPFSESGAPVGVVLTEPLLKAVKEDKKPIEEKTYEDQFTVEDFDKYMEHLRREASLVGFPLDQLPKKEELMAKANVPPEADRGVTMEAKAFAGVVRDILEDVIQALSNRIVDFYVDPENPLTHGEFNHLRDVVLYVMGGLNCQSAETSSASYKGEQHCPSYILRVRKKLKADVFLFLYEEFTRRLRASTALRPLFRTMYGYIIAAVDGSDINLHRNVQDIETSCSNGKGKKSYNQIHLNSVYDCLNNIYLAALFRGRKKTGGGERIALYEMLESMDPEIRSKILLTLDRGYEGHATVARLYKSGIKFLLRAKSLESNGMVNRLLGSLTDDDTFHALVRYRLSKKPVSDNGPLLISSPTYDFLADDEILEMTLRIMQFRLPSGELETLVTNIPMWELSPYQLYCMYDKRWAIETSYRYLKYQASVVQQHSIKVQYVRQELWGKLVMFNFAYFIISHTTVPETKRKHPRKYEYKVKCSRGIVFCRRFMAGDIGLEEFSYQLVQRLQPIRPGRSYPRNVRPKSVQSSQTMGIGM